MKNDTLALSGYSLFGHLVRWLKRSVVLKVGTMLSKGVICPLEVEILFFLLLYLSGVGITYAFVKIKQLNWSNGKIWITSLWTKQIIGLLYIFLF